MAFKRNIDRLPIPPRDAKVHNVTCHFCIVGCGYKAYSWPVGGQGGTAPNQNAFGVNLAQQQPADSPAWYSPSMYNIVKQNGRDVNIVIKPDHECSVNSGLGSNRGARMAETSYSATTGTLSARLTDPQVWRYGGMVPSSWDDAIGLVAEVTRRVVAEQGEDGLIVSGFDHGGAGGIAAARPHAVPQRDREGRPAVRDQANEMGDAPRVEADGIGGVGGDDRHAARLAHLPLDRRGRSDDRCPSRRPAGRGLRPRRPGGQQPLQHPGGLDRPAGGQGKMAVGRGRRQQRVQASTAKVPSRRRFRGEELDD